MSRFPKNSQPKLTMEMIEAICAPIRTGAYVETAVALAGISKDTFYRWLRLSVNDPPKSLTRKLSDAVKRAIAEAELRDIEVIEQAANGRAAEYMMTPMLDSKGALILDADGCPEMQVCLDGTGKPIKLRSEVQPSWQAAAWRLERRCPKRWGRQPLADDEFMREVEAAKEETPEEIAARAERLQRLMHMLQVVGPETDLGYVES